MREIITHLVLALERQDCIARVDLPDEGLAVLDADDVTDRGDVELGGNAGEDTTAFEKKCMHAIKIQKTVA